MQWWRRKQRTGAGILAFALVVQLVLWFGHIHLREILPKSQIAEAATVLLQKATAQFAPNRQHVPADESDDNCPMCIAMHMAGTGLSPVAPTIALPSEFSWIPREVAVEFDLIAPRHALYQTRAPPLA